MRTESTKRAYDPGREEDRVLLAASIRKTLMGADFKQTGGFSGMNEEVFERYLPNESNDSTSKSVKVYSSIYGGMVAKVGKDAIRVSGVKVMKGRKVKGLVKVGIVARRGSIESINERMLVTMRVVW